MSDPQKAVSIEILDVHLNYMRKDIEAVLKGMEHMATTDDIKKLSERMDKFVTADEFNALKVKVEASTLGSTFSRAMKTVQSVAVTIAALAAIFGVMAAFFKYYEIVKALV
jgi:hypothetical protein